MSDNKGKLLGKTLNELKAVAKELGMPAFTGTQLANWLYVADRCPVFYRRNHQIPVSYGEREVC